MPSPLRTVTALAAALLVGACGKDRRGGDADSTATALSADSALARDLALAAGPTTRTPEAFGDTAVGAATAPAAPAPTRRPATTAPRTAPARSTP
ncbi:MAG: hypothetical protein ACJ79S_12740, partial [Gemmatimonadaceae bacterium]